MVSWQTENANENAALSDEVYYTLLSSQLCKSTARQAVASIFPYSSHITTPYPCPIPLPGR